MHEKLKGWVEAFEELNERLNRLRPKRWANVAAHFMVEPIGLGFICDDKFIGWFRVRVLDGTLETIAYMEGANSGEVTPEVSLNVKHFSDDLLLEIFQMARCRREFERTDDQDFLMKFGAHRQRVLDLWQKKGE